SLDNISVIDILLPFDNPVELAEKIRSSRGKTFLLSPLISQYGPQLARQMGDRVFAGFDMAILAGEIPENLIKITTDRGDAFRAAGELCKNYLNDPANTGSKVAGLFYSGSATRVKERDAFVQGIGIDVNQDRFFIKSFPRLASISEANTFLNDLKTQNVGLYVVSMSSLSKDLVSSISLQSSSLIITERIGYGNVYADRMIASVEEHWAEAVLKVIDARTDVISVETTLKAGPASQEIQSSWLDIFRR
ncbi:MAG: hypothetical protein HN368_09285, partial [Spirochaetales bacterium]|nr:hypothetical protein [Spirochaetales bacterium]